MNIQTERLENHTARFTVEVELDRLEQAMRASASRLARRVNIPGFRKGKAPYKVLVSYVGESAVLEDAVEALGNEIYKDALSSSDIEPYGPGSLDEFEMEPKPTFTFTVPLRPTVDLAAYRDIRADYEAPVVEDEAVDREIKGLQQRHALVEESSQPVAAGNRVHIKVHAELIAEDKTEDAPEGDEGEAAENRLLIDRDDLPVNLTEDGEMMPGFAAALVGATVGEQRTFELTYPDDAEKYPELHGRRVSFDVTINKIETVTLPELTDDFAARVTADEEKQLTLLELRMRIREMLQERADDQAKATYAEQILARMVEQAVVAYPEALVSDQIDHTLQHIDADLRQRGLTLQDYLRISGKTIDDMRAEQREAAEDTIRRSLVLHEITHAEQIEVTDAQVDEEIDRIVAQFGDQAATFRSMYNRREMRDNLKDNLSSQKVMDRIVAIAKGEAPDLAPASDETPPPADDQ